MIKVHTKALEVPKGHTIGMHHKNSQLALGYSCKLKSFFIKLCVLTQRFVNIVIIFQPLLQWQLSL